MSLGDLSDHWFRALEHRAWLSRGRGTDLFGDGFYERDKPLVIEIANWTVADGRPVEQGGTMHPKPSTVSQDLHHPCHSQGTPATQHELP